MPLTFLPLCASVYTMQSTDSNNKKTALDNFQLFFEEVPIEKKQERRRVNETRIRRPSAAQ